MNGMTSETGDFMINYESKADRYMVRLKYSKVLYRFSFIDYTTWLDDLKSWRLYD